MCKHSHIVWLYLVAVRLIENHYIITTVLKISEDILRYFIDTVLNFKNKLPLQLHN